MLPKIALLAIIITIFGLIFFDVGLIASKYIKPNIPFLPKASSQPAASSAVSGVIKLNGQIPQGSSISIGVKDHGATGKFSIFASGLPAADETAWQYTNAASGNSYQFQAYLDSNGSVVSSSDILAISAPAAEEVLTLNVASQAPTPQPATISGNVYINGYIPPGATFDILGRVYGSSGNFSVVVDNLSATVKRTITYSTAQAGQKYEIKGQLFDSKGTVIGNSNSLVIAAPSDNAELIVNSSATPPVGAVTPLQNNTGSPASSPTPASSGLATGSSTISGTINFNGSAPSGSSIVILAAPQGTSNQYQTVVNGINPTNGASWGWNGAASGMTYNMVAVLKGQTNNQNIDYADSQTYTVAAPAQNQTFTINTGFALGAPSGPVFPTCTTHNSNNTWNMSVNFANVTGAQYYVLQLGSTSGGNDLVNTSQGAQPTTNQVVNATINDSVIYYTQYAVASVPNPTPAQLSPFSGPFTIKCP